MITIHSGGTRPVALLVFGEHVSIGSSSPICRRAGWADHSLTRKQTPDGVRCNTHAGSQSAGARPGAQRTQWAPTAFSLFIFTCTCPGKPVGLDRTLRARRTRLSGLGTFPVWLGRAASLVKREFEPTKNRWSVAFATQEAIAR